MSVRVTDSDPAALYDSVTDIAFGEVFNTSDEAFAFLEFTDGQDVRIPSIYDGLRKAWNESGRDDWLAEVQRRTILDIGWLKVTR